MRDESPRESGQRHVTELRVIVERGHVKNNSIYDEPMGLHTCRDPCTLHDSVQLPYNAKTG